MNYVYTFGAGVLVGGLLSYLYTFKVVSEYKKLASEAKADWTKFVSAVKKRV